MTFPGFHTCLILCRKEELKPDKVTEIKDVKIKEKVDDTELKKMVKYFLN
jgi:hypothetical protein